jgi:excisionase family DNA binding protein
MIDMSNDVQMLSPKDVAEILAIHPKTVHLWLRSGRLEGIKISYRTWRIPRVSLDSFIERNTNKQRQKPSVTTTDKKQKSNGNYLTEPGKGPTNGMIIHPQSKMKHYIRDIMGEQTHDDP